jgi:polyhydroxyalkanoate synthesis regulator phasin
VSAGDSGAARVRMAEPGSPVRELVERLFLAGVGAVSLTAERADALAEELADKGGLRKEEARELIDDATARWRGEAGRMGQRASVALESVFGELGLVTQDDFEELELRVAQVEHRLRLLEERPELPTPVVPQPPA